VIAWLPTPVTCHSIGTPLAGTQILRKYRGGTPTCRPLCTDTSGGRSTWLCGIPFLIELTVPPFLPG
jgi:hypothetical protein